MIRRCAVGLAILCADCAATTTPPPLPPPTDIDSLLGPAPRMPVVPAGLPDGKTQPIEAGQCKGLGEGIWISERRFAQNIVTTAERDRLRIEVDAYQKLRRTEREALFTLQDEFTRRLAAADRRAEIRLFTGLLVGAAVVLAGGWAVGQIGQ